MFIHPYIRIFIHSYIRMFNCPYKNIRIFEYMGALILASVTAPSAGCQVIRGKSSQYFVAKGDVIRTFDVVAKGDVPLVSIAKGDIPGAKWFAMLL